MSEITRELVQYVAGLARLRLSEEEQSYYQTQLGRVVDYVHRLDELDERLRGLDLGSEQGACFERVDEAESQLSLEAALENAPKKVGTAFQVPKIIE